jgi:hypothetical protein
MEKEQPEKPKTEKSKQFSVPAWCTPAAGCHNASQEKPS